MKYKAIFFDLDGTLVHTQPEYRYMMVRNVLGRHGLAAKDAHIDAFWFQGNRQQVIQEQFGIAPDLFWNTYMSIERANIGLRRDLTRPYEDTDFLKELQEKGYKLGIVTGAPQWVAGVEIEMLPVEFDAIRIAHYTNGMQHKPHPEALEACMKALGVERDEAIYVGNSDEDILTANNAGVGDVLVERDEHEFPHAKPSVTIASLYELWELLGMPHAAVDVPFYAQ